jgi:hypothetical protein
MYGLFPHFVAFFLPFVASSPNLYKPLTTNQLAKPFNQIPSHQPLQVESEFDAYGPTSCPNQSECKLLAPLMDSLVISHIFPHLPMTFHVLVHVKSEQGMVYGCCKKHFLECNGNGESKP